MYDLSDSESVTPLVTGFTGGSGVTCLLWKTGSVLAAATEGGHVLFWMLSTVKETLTLDAGSESRFRSLCFSILYMSIMFVFSYQKPEPFR